MFTKATHDEQWVLEHRGMAINHGLNKVRFPTPVPAGAKVRLSATLAEGDRPRGRCRPGHRRRHHGAVVTPDYAGSGRTTAPDGALTLDLLVQQIVAAIEDAVTAPVDVLGFSLGAVVAAALAARRPDLVRKLVLVAGRPASDDPRLQLALDAWAGSLTAGSDIASAVGPVPAFSREFLSGLGRDGMDRLRSIKPEPGTLRQIGINRDIDIRDDLRRITAPTLVVGCTRDQLVPVRHSRDLYAAVQHSRYVEIDSGHVVFFEQPAKLTTTADIPGYRSEPEGIRVTPGR
jgi:pimeloyl-ACP methyl ester carboxylesterase